MYKECLRSSATGRKREAVVCSVCVRFFYIFSRVTGFTGFTDKAISQNVRLLG